MIGENDARCRVAVDTVTDLLTRGSVDAIQMIPWSSNYTFAARLSARGFPDVMAVYKPRRGEAPLYDFPDGTLYLRERAAYLACVAFGWDFVPPTVVRDGPHGIGSYQLLLDADPEADFFAFKGNHTFELQRIALFDVLTNNADRKAGHCLKARDGKVWGIDHGLTFNAAPKLRTVIWDFAGEPVPETLTRQTVELRSNPARVARLTSQLGELLNDREVDRFFERIDWMIGERRYPHATSRRAVPWPWY